MDKVKITIIAVVSALSSWLGILAIPVYLLLACNVLDYITGLMAAKYRAEKVSSYKSIRGIIRKICMWLLVIVGCVLDIVIGYAISTVGISITLPFIVSTVVAVWLIFNEIISILENIIDMEVQMPPFLMPVVQYAKKLIEQKAAGETGITDRDDKKEEVN